MASRVAMTAFWGNLSVTATAVSGRVLLTHRNWAPSWETTWTDITTAPDQTPTPHQYTEVCIAEVGSRELVVVLRADGQLLYVDDNADSGWNNGLRPLYPGMPQDPAPFSLASMAGVRDSGELHVIAVTYE